MDSLQQVLHRQVYLYDINDRLSIFTPKSKGFNPNSTSRDNSDISDSQIDSTIGFNTVRDQTSTFRSSIPDAEPNYLGVEKQTSEEDKANEFLQNSMSMFIDDPIIANLPKKNMQGAQKYFLEEAFRS